MASHFYPRPPRGGRRCCLTAPPSWPAYFYPRPPRGGRRGRVRAFQQHPRISIHALREEGDLYECRLCDVLVSFLSTPSARRATYLPVTLHPDIPISIHALREEGDYGLIYNEWFRNQFLSTPSARRATGTVANYSKTKAISIHALREEGDKIVQRLISLHRNFYPRPPRGGRPRRPRNQAS